MSIDNFGEEVSPVPRAGPLESRSPISNIIVSSVLDDVARADPGNIQAVGAAQLALSNSYYESVLVQARRSFGVALVSAIVGLAFFVGAIALTIIQGNSNGAFVSVLAGGIVEVISGLNFWLYGRTASQLDAFHIRLDRTQRYLLANSVSTGVPAESRSAIVAKLVESMVAEERSASKTG